jgi:hypothetical protein
VPKPVDGSVDSAGVMGPQPNRSAAMKVARHDLAVQWFARSFEDDF